MKAMRERWTAAGAEVRRAEGVMQRAGAKGRGAAGVMQRAGDVWMRRVREALAAAGRAIEAGQQLVEGEEAPLVLGVIFLILIAL